MVKQSTTRQRRSVVLQVEQFEERLAPAVVTQDYPGIPYNTAYGTNVPGTLRPVAPYIAGGQKEVVLDSLIPTAAPSDTFKQTLQGAFGNWTFTYANASPQGLNLSVKTYYALANSTMSFTSQYGGMVGGVIDVTTNYQPAQGQTVRWIQVVTTNDPPPGQQIAYPAVSSVDNNANPNHPYYFGNSLYDQRGFTDASGRSNIGDYITWQAEMYLAVETAANTVTIYPDGIKWGWSIRDRNPYTLETPVLSVAANPNPSGMFERTTITATFTLPCTCVPNPMGNVTFVDDSGQAVLGRASIASVGGVVQAALPNVLLIGAGQHNVRATFDGDESWYGVTASYVHTVNKMNAQLNLGSSANPVAFGQSVTSTATVSAVDPDVPTPTGVVTFRDGTTTLGTVDLDASGQATLTVGNLGVAAHSITAEYGGDDYFDVSTSDDLTQMVNPAATTTRISASQSSEAIRKVKISRVFRGSGGQKPGFPDSLSVTVGTEITFWADVFPTEASPTTLPPTGTVTFYEVDANGDVLQTLGSLGSPAGSVTAVFTTSGPKRVQVVYSGDLYYEVSFAFFDLWVYD